MPPAQSDVWKYFTRSIDRKKATCNLCETELTYSGTTTNFRNHLRGKHPSLENNDSDSKKQTSMSSFVSTPKKVSSAESEKITQSIANMIVKDYLPLSIVEGDGFRNLMDNVMPVYKVPCRNTIRSRIVKRYDSERNMLIQSLESVDSVAITTDTWTSNTTESYITVTEHHIDNEWHMHSNVLLTRAMPERHTGENIAMKLKDCVSEFGLEGKVETCVHDNGRNMDCAGRKCEDLHKSEMLMAPDYYRRLFIHTQSNMTFDSFRRLYKVNFSPEGSNNRKLESDKIYCLETFRADCAEGESDVTLSDVLMFWTGADSEPHMGFEKFLEVDFVSGERKLPVAHTCGLLLHLVRGSSKPDLFKEDFEKAIKWCGGFHLC